MLDFYEVLLKQVLFWSSNTIIVFTALTAYGQLCASVLPYLGIISSTFSLRNFKSFLIKK